MVPVAFAVHPTSGPVLAHLLRRWPSGSVSSNVIAGPIRAPSDQGSRALIGITLWSGVLGAFLIAWTVPATRSGRGGVLLRWSGVHVVRHGHTPLGGADVGTLFRTVVLIHHHHLVTDGPYRLCRHPSMRVPCSPSLAWAWPWAIG
jgi:protein-S-isoprenylcysteine O-methyltransferase Ste14